MNSLIAKCSLLLLCTFFILTGSVAQIPGFTNYSSPTCMYKALQDGNNIWVMTSGGIMKFDTITKLTTRFNAYNSGLPCENVMSMDIDASGNKWFGTGGGVNGYGEDISSGRGLVKYDGVNWTVYKTTTSGISNNTIRYVYADNDTIWAGTDGGGISKFNGTTWVTYNRLNSGLPSDTVSSIVEDMNGLKWIATFKGVVSFDGTTWTLYNRSNSNLPSDTVRTIVIGPNNEKWIGTNNGIAKYNDTVWTKFTTSNSGLSYKNVVTILPESDGSIWYGTYGLASTYGGGIGKYNGAVWTNYNSINSGLPRNNVSFILSDASGKRWISSERGSMHGEGQGQISRFDALSTWETFDLANSALLVNAYYCVAIHPSTNNLWFGGEKSGITEFDGTNWTNYNNDNSALVDDDNYSAKYDSNENLWLTHDRGRITRFDGTNFVNYNTPTGILDDPFALEIDTADLKWLGCRGTGVFSFDETDTTWVSYNTSNSGLPHNYVNTIKIDAFGNKWIGTNGGLAFFDGTTWITYNVANSDLPHNTVSDIEIDQFGVKWITTYSGLAKFDGTTWTIYTTTGTGLPSNKLYCVSIDSYDRKWIGASTGMAKLDGTTWTTLTNFPGTPYNNVSDIGFDSFDNVWVATMGHGILRYNNSIITSSLVQENQDDLLLNYPNPALNETVISFKSDDTEKYIIAFFDAMGRAIEVPYNFYQNQETYSYKITTSELESGVYFYTLTSSADRKTGKMLVQK